MFSGTIALPPIAVGDWISSNSIPSGTKIGSEQKVVIDLSDVNFITLDSAQQVIAIASYYTSMNTNVSIRLPNNDRTLDFLKIWDFFNALEMGTGLKIKHMFSTEESARIKFEQNTYKNIRTRTYRGETYALRSENFFGFSTLRFPSAGAPAIASSEAQWWREEEIMTILRRRLGIEADELPSRVIFEAIFNAAKNPTSTLVQTALWHQSEYVERSERMTPNSNSSSNDDGNGADSFDSDKGDLGTSSQNRAAMTLTVWDNGLPIVDTLEAAQRNGNIRVDYDNSFDCEYLVNIDRPNTMVEKHLVNSRVDLTRTLSPDFLALASFFPGVSGGEYNMKGAFDRRLVEKEPERASRGMGLATLAEAICHTFSGKLFVRSGQHVIYMRKAKKGQLSSFSGKFDASSSYYCRLKRQPAGVPRIQGTILSFILPTARSRKS